MSAAEGGTQYSSALATEKKEIFPQSVHLKLLP